MKKQIFSFNGLKDYKIQRLINNARKEQKITKSIIYNNWIIQAQEELNKRKMQNEKNKQKIKEKIAK